MCSKQNGRLKSKCVQHNYWNKWIRNFNNAYHANINVNVMEKNVIHIKSGIIINVDVSVKNIYVKNIVFGILLHVVVKMVNIYQILFTIQ